MKKAFTLIELLISMAIIGILTVIVFKIYIELSNISVKIENEKTLSNEMLFLSQSIQNLSDKGNLDYTQYSNLQNTYGLTGNIYFSGEDGKYKIYATGDCIDDIAQIKDKYCWIQMNRDGQIIDLTDKNKVYFTKFYFKITPYDDPSKLTLSFNDIYHNGFGMYSQVYIKKYNEKLWPFNVMINYQSFYNIRKY